MGLFHPLFLVYLIIQDTKDNLNNYNVVTDLLQLH